MRVIAYARVSTRRQVQGHGLTRQFEIIHEEAAKCGHAIVACCRDAGVSGLSFYRRGLLDAIYLVVSGEADAIMVEHYDRISRSAEVSKKIWLSLGGWKFIEIWGAL